MIRDEDQNTITDWANRTFGGGAYEAVCKRAVDEINEFLAAVAEDRRADVKAEMPDIVITLYRLATVLGFDLLQSVDDKMAVNRLRRWISYGDGTGQHVPDGDA